jgi:predicted glycosyltransferase
VKIYPYLSTKERIDILNRADFIISRSGYTTIMDLSMGGQKALFSPTVGQPEQEYLSEYHNKKGTYMSVNQEEVDILQGIKDAKRFKGVKKGSSEKAVENAMQVLFG